MLPCHIYYFLGAILPCRGDCYQAVKHIDIDFHDLCGKLLQKGNNETGPFCVMDDDFQDPRSANFLTTKASSTTTGT